MKIQTSAQLIRSLRKERKLTQADLARATSVSQPSISRIESGLDHDPAQITTLLQYLQGTAIVQIGTGSGEPEVPKTDLLRDARFSTRWEQKKPAISLEIRLNQAMSEFGDSVKPLFERLSAVQRNSLAAIDFDSSWELLFTMRLLSFGWDFARATLASIGCQWPVRDRDQAICLTNATRWMLVGKYEGMLLVLVPQLTLAATPPIQMDFTGVVVRGDCRAPWRVEVQGPCHDGKKRQDLKKVLQSDIATLPIDRAGLIDPLLQQQLITFARPLAQRPQPVRQAWR